MSQQIPGLPTQPFPGLRPFEASEECIFRGRQDHTKELLRRLSEHRFLAIVGTSGSGKSSLVRAGLRPALDRGYLAGATSRWRIALMRPGDAPIENLAAALKHRDALDSGVNDLRSSSLALVEAVRDKLAPGESLLVIADQFEELFGARRKAKDGGSDASLFVSLLLKAARRPDASIYVVLTMRSDFLGDCSQFPGLPEALSESQYLIPRLSRNQRRQAIEEPLALYGARMTPQLVEQLLNDSGDEEAELDSVVTYRGGAPDPLPVLQHALMRTYAAWKDLKTSGPIDLDQYKTAGRMASALNDHAEDVFNNSLDDDGRYCAQRIFRCLTTTELGRPVRRPTALETLYSIAGKDNRDKIDDTIRILRDNLFLQLNEQPAKEGHKAEIRVDISHESLIWKWKRFGDWVTEETASADLYRDLAKAVGDAPKVKPARWPVTWLNFVRKPIGVWTEPKLSAALLASERDWNEDWARQYSDTSYVSAQELLARSARAARNDNLLRRLALIGAVGMVILGTGLYNAEKKKLTLTGEKDSLIQRFQAIQRKNEAFYDSQARDIKARLEGSQQDKGAALKDLEIARRASQVTTQQQIAGVAKLTDLQATAKLLQARLDVAEEARRREALARQDAEAEVAKLNKMLAEHQGPSSASTTVAQTTQQAPQPAELPPATVSSGPDKPKISPRINHLASTRLAHRASVRSVAWSPDGKTLVSAGDDQAIRYWSMLTPMFPNYVSGYVPKGMNPGAESISFSGDGKFLLVAGGVTLQLFDASPRRFLVEARGLVSVKDNPWNKVGRILSFDVNQFRVDVLQTPNLRQLRQIKTGVRVVSAAWSPDGKMTAGTSAAQLVRIWDANSGKPLRTLRGPTGVATAISWSPDGKRIAATFRDILWTWDSNTGEGSSVQPMDQYATSVVSYSPNGAMLAWANSAGNIRLMDPAGAKDLVSFGRPGTINQVAWSPDSKYLAAARSDGAFDIWSVEDTK